ncbi:MAG: hypothetical protein PHT33_10860 [bacterium]|nr:hypothetical protein [bacterium]
MYAHRTVFLVVCLLLSMSFGVPAEEQGGVAPNLVVNPTFKDFYTSWHRWAPSGVPADGFKADNRAGADDNFSVYMQGFDKSACLYQRVEATPGAKYRLRFKYRTAMKEGTAQVSLRFQVDKEILPQLWYQTDEAKWTQAPIIKGQTDKWESCELEIKVPEDKKIKYVVPMFAVGKQAPDDKFYVDAVEFYVIK